MLCNKGATSAAATAATKPKVKTVRNQQTTGSKLKNKMSIRGEEFKPSEQAGTGECFMREASFH